MPIQRDGSARKDIAFTSGGGDTCRGWLYLPDTDERRPIVVLAHGLGAVKEMRLDAYAERFRAAGYACLVFDYRHFGASDGEPRQLLDIERQRTDWTAAVAFARSLPEVDGRVVLWGSSFGGGHVIVMGARLPGIAAVISQCPFTDGLASAMATSPVTTAKLLPAMLADLAAAARGKPPVLVPLAGPPGTAALMTAPDVVPGYLRLVPEGMAFRNEASGRIGLRIATASPGRSARKVPCPILFCVCDDDTVAPARATLRHARKAPRGEIKRYPFGHFDIYVGGGFERAVRDQIDFLNRHVPIG
ncbi:MAG: alpha/beta hydrolase [Mycobacterium sp.]